MINLLEYLESTVTKFPDKDAFIDEEGSYTFSELDKKIKSTGTAILKRGLKSEPVLVFMEKSIKEIAAFFGVIAAGCYYVPIDSEMPLFRIQMIVENCNPRICIVDNSTKEAAEKLDTQETSQEQRFFNRCRRRRRLRS